MLGGLLRAWQAADAAAEGARRYAALVGAAEMFQRGHLALMTDEQRALLVEAGCYALLGADRRRDGGGRTVEVMIGKCRVAISGCPTGAIADYIAKVQAAWLEQFEAVDAEKASRGAGAASGGGGTA